MKLWLRAGQKTHLLDGCGISIIFNGIYRAFRNLGYDVVLTNPGERCCELWWPGNWETEKNDNFLVGYTGGDVPFSEPVLKGWEQLDALFVVNTYYQKILEREFSVPIYALRHGVAPNRFPAMASAITGTYQSPFVFIHCAFQSPRKGGQFVCEAFSQTFSNEDVLLEVISPADEPFFIEMREKWQCLVARLPKQSDNHSESVLLRGFRSNQTTNSESSVETNKQSFCQKQQKDGNFKKGGNNPKIHFITVHRPHSQMYKNYHGHCFVYPSLYESWGLCVTEAMCSGMPCIISRLPTFNDQFNELCGWWVNMDEGEGWGTPNINDLSSKMRYAYEHREECREKGMYAAAMARHKLTFEHGILLDLLPALSKHGIEIDRVIEPISFAEG